MNYEFGSLEHKFHKFHFDFHLYYILLPKCEGEEIGLHSTDVQGTYATNILYWLHSRVLVTTSGSNRLCLAAHLIQSNPRSVVLYHAKIVKKCHCVI